MKANDRDWTLLTQDLLQLEQPSSGLLLDVGWYPDESPEGQFSLKLLLDEDWNRPLLILTTGVLADLVSHIESMLEAPPHTPIDRLIERLGHHSPEARSAAARALAQCNAFEAIAHIRDALGREWHDVTIDRMEQAMRMLIEERNQSLQT